MLLWSAKRRQLPFLFVYSVFFTPSAIACAVVSPSNESFFRWILVSLLAGFLTLWAIIFLVPLEAKKFSDE
jgi:hypothetical protein